MSLTARTKEKQVVVSRINLDSVWFWLPASGCLLFRPSIGSCLIFACGTRRVTRLRLIDVPRETGHKRASRGKEVDGERRRSGASRPDDPVSGRIAGSVSGDVRAAGAGFAAVSFAPVRRLRNRRRSASGNIPSNASIESRIQPRICGQTLGVRSGAKRCSDEPARVAAKGKGL